MSDWPLLAGAIPIQYKIAAGSVPSFDFTGIPATYKSLLVILFLRGDAVANGTNTGMRFNNDSAGVYYSQQTSWSNTTNAASASVASTQGFTGDCPAANDTADRFSAGFILIPGYYKAVRKKTYTGEQMEPGGTTAASMQKRSFGGVWDGAAAIINQVTIYPVAAGTPSGNFVIDSEVAIYGLN